MPDAAPSRARGVADSWQSLMPSAAARQGELEGYYHRNHLVRLPWPLALSAGLPPGAEVKIRVPIVDAVQYNLRIWPESELLDAIQGRVEGSPRVLAVRPGFSVHTFVEGEPLSHHCRQGARVGREHIAGVGELFRQTAAVPTELLPASPEGWPEDGDSAGFLRRLIDFTDTEVRLRHHRRFAGLFHELGVRDGILEQLADRTTELTARPFTLLHTDIHRDNLIVASGGQLALIDWELALYGDPLYELASHLCRMRYLAAAQRRAAVAAWARAIGDSRPAALRGYESDLAVYVAYEKVHSVHTDVVRQALALGDQPDHEALAAAARTVHHVLFRARHVLGLRRTPGVRRTLSALARWHREEPAVTAYRWSRRGAPDCRPPGPRRSLGG